MAQEPVFDVDKCPVPFVPRIPQGVQVIEDCDVPPPPDPIFDCPNFDLEIPPPVSRPSPCPQFQVYTFIIPSEDENFDLEGFVEQLPRLDDRDPCEYDFFFALRVPENLKIPCPQITATSTIECDTTQCQVFINIRRIQECIRIPIHIQNQPPIPVVPQECAYQFQFQFQVPQGPQGPQGPRGMKNAVVPVGSEENPQYVGLACMEMPDPYFMDIMTCRLQGYQTEVNIDPRFLQVCHLDSMKVVGAVPSEPVLIGATVVDDQIVLKSPGFQAFPEVVVTLAGFRRGFDEERFPAFTREQMLKNNTFWDQARG